MAEDATTPAGEPAGAATEAGEKKAELETLREGKAEVLHAVGEAFYNPAQVFFFFFTLVTGPGALS